MTTASTHEEIDARLDRTWLGVRLPVFFRAPAEPLVSRPLRWEGASPAQFARRVLFAAPGYLLPAGALLAVSSIAEALVPVVVGHAIDDAISAHDGAGLAVWIVLLALDFAVITFAYRFGSRMGLFGMQTVQHRLRTQVTDRLLHPAGVRTGHADGAALSIATSDVTELAATMRLCVYPVGAGVSLLFCVVALSLLAWPLGLAVLLGCAALFVVVFVAGAPLQRRMYTQQELTGDAVGRAADLLTGYRVLKGLRAEGEAARRYRTASRAALAGTLGARRTEGAFVGLMDGLGGLLTAALTVLAGFLALRGDLTVGGLISAVGLIQYVVGALSGIGLNVGAIWAQGCASAQRVLTILQAPTLHGEDRGTGGGGRSGETAGPAVHAAQVSGSGAGDGGTPDRTGSPASHAAGATAAGPAPQAPPAPADASAPLRLTTAGATVVVEPGERVGLRAAPVTATRLVRALAASAAPDDDTRADLGGRTCDDLGVAAWRHRILVAPHRSELFDGSVAWNLDVPGATPASVAAALDAAACADVLATLPDGLDTPVGEGGFRLSGGQRQRIALARAYAADPPVLVLHDPTTAVDAATEAEIAARLPGIRAGRTTLLVTASPALLAACDRVVDLRDDTTDTSGDPA